MMRVVHSQRIFLSVLYFHQRSTDLWSFDRHFNSKRQKCEVVLSKEEIWRFKYLRSVLGCDVTISFQSYINITQHISNYATIIASFIPQPFSCSYVLLYLSLFFLSFFLCLQYDNFSCMMSVLLLSGFFLFLHLAFSRRVSLVLVKSEIGCCCFFWGQTLSFCRAPRDNLDCYSN